MIITNDFLKKGFLILLFLFSCNSDLVDDPIPFQPFPDINIILSNHPALGSDGGYILINDGGVRGIILYRKNSSTYLAFERNCMATERPCPSAPLRLLREGNEELLVSMATERPCPSAPQRRLAV